MLSSDKLGDFISELRTYNSSFVSSELVPQANSLERINHLLDYIKRDTPLNKESVGLSDRQVRYYVHASKILGLIDEDVHLTTLGRLVLLSDGDEKKRALKLAIEKSEFGKAWIAWSGMSTIEEIDPETAAEFLRQRSPDLSSRVTLSRRASTIRRWLKTLNT